MTAKGAFHFQMDDIPEKAFAVKTARIGIFVPALTEGRLGLNINVFAEPQDHVDPTRKTPYSMAPAFYTEWLTIDRNALRSRGHDALAGYGFDYDAHRPDAPPEAPGAVQQDSHALFDAATLELEHLSGATYRVTTQGMTEFKWTFRLWAEADFNEVRLRDGTANSAREPDPEVESEFADLFEPALFDASWRRCGSQSYGWHDYIATPKHPSPDPGCAQNHSDAPAS